MTVKSTGLLRFLQEQIHGSHKGRKHATVRSSVLIFQINEILHYVRHVHKSRRINLFSYPWAILLLAWSMKIFFIIKTEIIIVILVCITFQSVQERSKFLLFINKISQNVFSSILFLHLWFQAVSFLPLVRSFVVFFAVIPV